MEADQDQEGEQDIAGASDADTAHFPALISLVPVPNSSLFHLLPISLLDLPIPRLFLPFLAHQPKCSPLVMAAML